MEGGRSSSNKKSKNPNPNPNSSKNNGKAPATSSPTAANRREAERYMPIANVVRIMRQALPQHAKISDEAKETVQESVSEFIAFVTEEANERCRREQRKTITGDDLLWSMARLGFDNYVDPLKTYLEKYRQNDSVGLGKREMVARQRRHAYRAAGLPGPATASPVPAFGSGSVGVMPMIDPNHGMMMNPYLNGCGSGMQSGSDHDHGPNPSPVSGLGLGCAGDGGGGFEMSGPSTPSTDESESEMSFLDLLNQYNNTK